MPKNNETTTKFKVDISELKAGIQEANRQIRLANAQFKAASSGMDDWSKSTDGVSAKIKQLETVLQSENTKLANLEKQLALVEKEQGENSKGADELRIAIANQQATVNKTEKSLNGYKAKLQELEKAQENSADAADEQKSAYDKLENIISQQKSKLANLKKEYSNVVLEQGKNSDAAKSLSKEIKSLSANLNKNENALERVDDAADDLTESFDNAKSSTGNLKEGFTVFKGTVANLVADGIKNLVSSVVNLASETREYRTEMAKLETAFANHGAGVDTAKETYKEFYGVLGDEGQSVEAVNHLAKLTDNEKDLATWTDICTGVYGEFGASLPIEGLTEAANETAKVGQVTGPLADALNWAGESEDAFNEKLAKCSTEQERQQLIMNTLNDIYSDSADKFRETNSEVIEANKAQSDLNDTTARLGEIAEPVITKVKEGFAKLLDKVVELVSDGDVDAFADKIEEAFTWLDENVITPLINLMKWVIDNKDLVIAGISGIAGAMTAMKVYNIVNNAVKAFQAFKAVNEGATIATYAQAAAQKLLNLVMNANPIGLIISLIAGLVIAFITLWNKSEKFRNFFIGMWDNIKKAVSVAWDFIKKIFSGAWDAIKGIWEGAGKFFSGIWDGIKNAFSNVGEFFGNAFKKGKEARDKQWENTKKWASNTWGKIKDGFANVGGWFKKQFTEAKENRDKAFANTKEWASGVWEKTKSGFSKVGKFFGDNFKDGYDNMKNAFSGTGNFFGGIWDTIKEKFTNIGQKIGGAMSDAFKKAVNAVLSKAVKIINGFIRGINWAIGIINKIPGVNINKLNELEVPTMYRGGVLKKGQVGLLEGNGAEAVVPLENNAGWIRKTARDLKAQLKNEGLVGGKGQVTNNYNFTQNNTSPKALSRLEIYRQTKNQLAFAKGV